MSEKDDPVFLARELVELAGRTFGREQFDAIRRSFADLQQPRAPAGDSNKALPKAPGDTVTFRRRTPVWVGVDRASGESQTVRGIRHLESFRFIQSPEPGSESQADPVFTGDCTCSHDKVRHGWAGCNVKGCGCFACWYRP